MTQEAAGWTLPAGTASFFALPAADIHTLTGNVTLSPSEISFASFYRGNVSAFTVMLTRKRVFGASLSETAGGRRGFDRTGVTG